MNTIISQGVFDSLDKSLVRNAKALKDPALTNLHQKILSNARTTLKGVEVPTRHLTLALTSVQRIVRINGGKYNSLPDELLIDDLTDALSSIAEEEATVGSFEADSGPAKTTPPDVITSVESLNVACSIAPDQQPTTTDAYNYPPTPVAGEETGRPTQHYKSFDRKFIWQIRDYNKVAEAPLDYWKSSRLSRKRSIKLRP